MSVHMSSQDKDVAGNKASGLPQNLLLSAARGLSLKMVLVGCLGIFITCGLSLHSALVVKTTPMGTNWFPLVAIIGLMAILFVVNPILRIFHWELDRAEMIIVFSMLFVGAIMANDGFAITFLANVLSPYYAATPNNAYWAKLLQYTPAWLYPADARAITWFWEGAEGQPIPWAAFAGPGLVWGIVYAAFFGMMLSMAAIMRKQWVENERLIFPLMEVPQLLMEREKGRLIPPIMRSRLFWVGTALVVFVFGSQLLHRQFNSIPQVRIFGWGIFRMRLVQSWTDQQMNIFPIVIALGYLVKRDVALSYWLFALMAYVQNNLMSSVGYNPGPSVGGEEANPALAWQSFGALAVFALTGLFMARGHLKNVLRKVLFDASDVDESREVMRFRTSATLLLFSCTVMGIFLTQAGMAWPVAMTLIATMLLIHLAATRFVVEGGMAFGKVPVAAFAVIIAVFGTQTYPLATLGALAACMPFVGHFKSAIMPTFANTTKLADGLNLKRGVLVKAVLIAIVLGGIGSLISVLLFGYSQGAASSTVPELSSLGQNSLKGVVQSIDSTPGPSTVRFGWAAVGAIAMTLLLLARYNFAWWPLHPIGLPLTASSELRSCILSFFIAWLCKTLLLRLGGVTLYERAKPLFIGLLVGHALAALLAYVMDLIFGGPGMSFSLP